MDLTKYHKFSPREQFQLYLKTIQPKDGSKHLWLKFGHDRFYVTDNWANNTDVIGGYITRKDSEKIRIKTDHVKDLYEGFIQQITKISWVVYL